LWNLYHFTRENGTPCGFQLLIDYAKKHNLLPKWFEDNGADKTDNPERPMKNLSFNTPENTAN
jgi:hypothetical protein